MRASLQTILARIAAASLLFAVGYIAGWSKGHAPAIGGARGSAATPALHSLAAAGRLQASEGRAAAGLTATALAQTHSPPVSSLRSQGAEDGTPRRGERRDLRERQARGITGVR